MAAPWEKYQKSVADAGAGPWQKYAPQKAEPEAPSRKAEAGLAGFGQAGTLGYMPQISAATEPVTTAILDLLTGQDVGKYDKSAYVERRDAEIKRLKELEQQEPMSYGAGGLAGTIATAAVPGKVLGGVLKGAQAVPGLGLASKAAQAGLAAKPGLLGRTAQAATGGAAMAGLANPGDVEGVVSPLQLEERAESAKAGGLIGSAVPSAGYLAGKVGEKLKDLPSRIKSFGETRAASALGLFQKHINKMAKESGLTEEKVKELGNFAIKNKLVSPGDEVLDIAKKSADLQHSIGEKIGKLYDEADTILASGEIKKSVIPELQKTELNKTVIANDFEKFIQSKFKNKRQAADIIEAAKKESEAILSHEKDILSVRDLQDYKKSLDEVIYNNKSALSAVPPASKEATKMMRDFVKDKITARIEAMDKAIGGNVTKQLKQLNKDYGLAAKAAEISNDRVASELGNNFLSLTDKMALFGGMGAGVASADSPEEMIKRGLLGAGAGLASKAARTYGRPLMMQGALKLGERMERPADIAGPIYEQAGKIIKESPLKMGSAAAGLLSKPKYGEKK